MISFVKDRAGHDKRYAIDASKIESTLGWKAKENFESGIVKTIEWYFEKNYPNVTIFLYNSTLSKLKGAKMFKKVKHSNGKREIYFGKKKIFQYLRQSQFADFVQSKLNNIADFLPYRLSLETAKRVYDTNKLYMDGGGGKLLCF